MSTINYPSQRGNQAVYEQNKTPKLHTRCTFREILGAVPLHYDFKYYIENCKKHCRLISYNSELNEFKNNYS